MEYLVDNNRLEADCIEKFEETGTLSHMLIVELARYEEERTREGRTLPKWEPPKRPRLKETDAERHIAFSQEQRRALADNAGDSKRAAETEPSREPWRRAAESEGRLIISRSVKRDITQVRQSREGNKI